MCLCLVLRGQGGGGEFFFPSGHSMWFLSFAGVSRFTARVLEYAVAGIVGELSSENKRLRNCPVRLGNILRGDTMTVTLRLRRGASTFVRNSCQFFELFQFVQE